MTDAASDQMPKPSGLTRDMASDMASDLGGLGSLELSLVNDLRELPRIAAAIDDFCRKADLGQQLGYAVNLAVDEMLNYTIGHSYGDNAPHRLEVAIYRDPGELSVLIVHDGQPLPLAQLPSAAAELILDDDNIDQLGIHLIRQMMDAVSFDRQEGFNVIAMTKRLPSEPGPPEPGPPEPGDDADTVEGSATPESTN